MNYLAKDITHFFNKTLKNKHMLFSVLEIFTLCDKLGLLKFSYQQVQESEDNKEHNRKSINKPLLYEYTISLDDHSDYSFRTKVDYPELISYYKRLGFKSLKGIIQSNSQDLSRLISARSILEVNNIIEEEDVDTEIVPILTTFIVRSGILSEKLKTLVNSLKIYINKEKITIQTSDKQPTNLDNKSLLGYNHPELATLDSILHIIDIVICNMLSAFNIIYKEGNLAAVKAFTPKISSNASLLRKCDTKFYIRINNSHFRLTLNELIIEHLLNLYGLSSEVLEIHSDVAQILLKYPWTTAQEDKLPTIINGILTYFNGELQSLEAVKELCKRNPLYLHCLINPAFHCDDTYIEMLYSLADTSVNNRFDIFYEALRVYLNNLVYSSRLHLICTNFNLFSQNSFYETINEYSIFLHYLSMGGFKLDTGILSSIRTGNFTPQLRMSLYMEYQEFDKENSLETTCEAFTAILDDTLDYFNGILHQNTGYFSEWLKNIKKKG